MRVVAIVQARMGSTRLPGKVLQDISGQSMLARVVRRLGKSQLIDETIVATSDRDGDVPIRRECERLGVRVFCGDEDDVLDRFYQAAVQYAAEAVVRITGDCPLIDAGVSDHVIQSFLGRGPDYACNFIKRTYPRGLDTEIMGMPTLERTWREASEPYQRVHVTPYIYTHPEQFCLLSVCGKRDYSHLRWTVDTPEDLEFVRAVYSHLEHLEDFCWVDVLDLLQREQSLGSLNRHIQQKALHEG